MILHTVNKAAPHQALQLCLRFAREEDIIVLLEDGVCNGVSGSAAWCSLRASACKQIVALEHDLRVRGLAGRHSSQLKLIDYPALVALCCQCDKMQSWF